MIIPVARRVACAWLLSYALAGSVVWVQVQAAAAAGGAPRGGAGIGACALLPPKAELKRILKSNNPSYDVAKPVEDPLGESGSECQYGDVGVQLDPFTPAHLEQLAKQQGAKWTSVSGVG